jgi:transposase
MIVQQVIFPCSKLGTTRLWHATSLAEQLSVTDADHDELYAAMDWLLDRQSRIEKKLAERHLAEGALVLYDITSSYYEGRTCPLARFGHDRDKKKGHRIIVYGLLADREGRPVSVSVYPGNQADPKTVSDQVDKIRQRFGLERVVLVGDRGMLTETQIEHLKEYPGLGWISALRSAAIRQLVNQGSVQQSLFDKKDLAEVRSPDFPGERLVACFNPLLADERRRKRDELLAATERQLQRIAAEVQRRTKKPLTKTEIALKVGRVLNRYKVGKHYRLTIEDNRFEWERNEESIRDEALLDGIYVIRTSETRRALAGADAVRSYKRLSEVEQAFRSLKSLELLVRPIRHRDENRVRAHIFLCMLAYYVQWHLKRVWAPLLFSDEELPTARAKRHPVKAAQPSKSAARKKVELQTTTGYPVHSFRTLLNDLGTYCLHECTAGSNASPTTFQKINEPTPLQAEAFRLVECSQY